MSGVEDYLKHIKEIIDGAPYVLSRSLEFEDRGGIALVLRGKLVFDDFSELYIREYILLSGKPEKIAYSYHYQDEKSTLIFRYDNAEHHPEVETYPHHKHVFGRSPVRSDGAALNEVILEICSRFMKKQV